MEELDGLVRAAQRGESEAFGRIVVRFQNMAYASAYAQLGDFHLAQDAAQGDHRQPPRFELDEEDAPRLMHRQWPQTLYLLNLGRIPRIDAELLR